MAESSEGGYKPADFFVGVVDLFAIVLPGALLTFLIHSLGYTSLLDKHLPEKPEKWVAFLIASYILGHFVFAVGSKPLDTLYEKTYKRWYREYLDSLLKVAKPILRDTYKVQFTFEEKYVSVLEWATTFVRLQNASAASEIDRLEADSKFFRSLATLVVVSALLLIVRVGSISCGVLAVYGALFAAVLYLSLWRFMKQRLKRSEVTYQFFIALSKIGPSPTNSRSS
jgi:hypothetical protein